MSSDDRVFPVLGYSVDRPITIDNMAPAVRFWLDEYDDQIAKNILNDDEPAPKVVARWNELLKMMSESDNATTERDNAASGVRGIPVRSLLSTTWGQGLYYNAACPYDNTAGARTVTGCVATAMGQIMKYWQWPSSGVGSNTYTDPTYGTQAANFAYISFNFSSMPDYLHSMSTNDQKNAVSLLLQVAGIAVNMHYGVNGSSATTNGYGEFGIKTAENAYRENFKYKHTLHTISLENYTDAEWISTIIDEIDADRPVHYSAISTTDNVGHSFICCGYNYNGQLYFNWGWNGNGDGFYTVGALNPSSTERYNRRNRAIVGLAPNISWSTPSTFNLAVVPAGAGTAIGGGTYTAYQDTVRLEVVNVRPGYLFDRWEDGFPNPWVFLADGGGTVTHTAYLEKMEGDTLGYCYNNKTGSLGIGTAAYKIFWGIRLDSVTIKSNRVLKKVETYIESGETGDYKVHVYEGTATRPLLCIHSDTFNVTTDGCWTVLTLSDSIRVDTTQSLWIILERNSAGYPLTHSQYRLNRDGSWYTSQSVYNTWNNDTTLSFMIRGIFGDYNGPFQISAAPADASMGVVIGGGQYMKNATPSLIAIPFSHYHFVRWQDGNTNASRQITVTDDATYTATFAANPTYLYPSTATICQGGSYTWRNRTFTTPGVYYDSLQTTLGEDSVYMLTLTVNPKFLIQNSNAICQGESYQWRGRNLTATGVYYDSLVSSVGCDSVYKLTLTVNYKHLMNDNATICQGDVCQWRGRNLTVAGVYNDSLLTSSGCDSVFRLTLTVNSSYLMNDNAAICQGDVYQWRGRNLTVAGVYNDSLLTSSGCDSVYVLVLSYNEHNITVNVNDAAMGSATGGGTYLCGDTATLSAVANADYVFTGWSNGEKTNTIYVMVVSDSLFTATFAPVETSVEDLTMNEVYVAGAEGAIVISDAEGSSIVVYDALGRMIASVEKAEVTEIITVPVAGVYFVRVADKATCRIVVK